MGVEAPGKLQTAFLNGTSKQSMAGIEEREFRCVSLLV
jgi:hypothetical protein